MGDTKSYDDIEFDIDKEVQDQWGVTFPRGLFSGEVRSATLRHFSDATRDQMWLDVVCKCRKNGSGETNDYTMSQMVGKEGGLNLIGLKVPKAILAGNKKMPSGKVSLKDMAAKLAGCKIQLNVTAATDPKYNDYRYMSKPEFDARVAEMVGAGSVGGGKGAGEAEDDSSIPF